MGRKVPTNKGKEKRLARKEERQKVALSMAAVAKANALEDPLKPFPAFRKFERDGLGADITCMKIAQVDNDTFEWIFGLMERNMRKSYEQCSWGWNSERKRNEMTEDAAWYLIAKDPSGKNLGFSHFRFDMDYGEEVLYCYELQLENTTHRRGLGSFLLHALELIAFTNQMRKVILTVLLNNKPAVSFFKALRYVVDESNPDEEEEAPYEILSKPNPRMSRAPPAAPKAAAPHPLHSLLPSGHCCEGGHHH